MKTCPTCQKQLDDAASACPGCGKKFTTGSGVFWAVLLGLILGGLLLGGLIRR